MSSRRATSGNLFTNRVQKDPFSSTDAPTLHRAATSNVCNVVAVGKRRDGGTRYWCIQHKADATAKYGKPAKVCRAAHIPPIDPKEMFSLDIDKYKGGIALWGAVPPIYDTTTLPMDRGIHVHARRHVGAKKEMDRTFRAVRIMGDRLPKEGIFVSELDAIYCMATSVFGFEMAHVTCSYCGHPHLDRDWFSVHPDRRHLCAGCGRHFSDDRTAIGNPISGIREACGVKKQKTKPADSPFAYTDHDRDPPRKERDIKPRETSATILSRYFPFAVSLEPIQTRSAVHFNIASPLRVYRQGGFSVATCHLLSPGD